MTLRRQSPAGLPRLSSHSADPSPQLGCFTNPNYIDNHPHTCGSSRAPPQKIGPPSTQLRQSEPNSFLFLIHHKIPKSSRDNLPNISLLSNPTRPTPYPKARRNPLLSSPVMTSVSSFKLLLPIVPSQGNQSKSNDVTSLLKTLQWLPQVQNILQGPVGCCGPQPLPLSRLKSNIESSST